VGVLGVHGRHVGAKVAGVVVMFGRCRICGMLRLHYVSVGRYYVSRRGDVMVAWMGVVKMLVVVFGRSLTCLAWGTSCTVGCVAMVGYFVVGHVGAVVVGCAFGSNVSHSCCKNCVLADFGIRNLCMANSSWLVVRAGSCFGMSGDFSIFVVSVVIEVRLPVGGIVCVG
jgi:hypothetical protein